MASKSGSESASSQSGSSKGGAGQAAPAAAKPASDYSIHKSYGGTKGFMDAHGLKMSSSADVDEMHAITDAYKAADAQKAKSARRKGKR